MVASAEQRAIQEENAKDGERFWDTLRDLNASSIEGRKALIAEAEAENAEQALLVAQAAEMAEVAKSRLERIRRGEDVARGLGKPPDTKAMLKAAGITPSLQRRARLLASLTKAEFEMMNEWTRDVVIGASDKASTREARRTIRARTP